MLYNFLALLLSFELTSRTRPGTSFWPNQRVLIVAIWTTTRLRVPWVCVCGGGLLQGLIGLQLS